MGKVVVVVRKHSCKKVWCPKCSQLFANEFINHLKIMNWKNIRHVVLTVDPSEYKASIDSYRFLTKQVAYFIKDLKRYEKINIVRYIKVLEFHRNGLPHFHLLIEKDAPGMIGKYVIERYWKYGNVWEEYFRNEQHFKEFMGYFNKHGYLEKNKEHQTKLPKWGMDSNEVIRKFIYSFNYFKHSPHPGVEKDKKEKRENNAHKTRCLNTNEFRIAQCGTKTKLEGCLYGKEWQKTCIVNIPFHFWMKTFNDEIEYRENVGFILKIDKKILYNILKLYDNDADIFIEDRIEKGFLRYSDIERRIEYLRNI